MRLEMPEVTKCCFCCSLRWGIILFGYINLIFSVAAASLIATTELKRKKNLSHSHYSIEVVTATVLFAILGMGVVLNILLLAAGFQKNTAMLRLYNCYAWSTVVAAVVPTFILLSRVQLIEGFASVIAIAMQFYVIVLVRSEIIKLKRKKAMPVQPENSTAGCEIDVPDTDTLV